MEDIQKISYRELVSRIDAANEEQASASLAGCRASYNAASSRKGRLTAEKLRRVAKK